MNCPREDGVRCPARDCPGGADPGVCRHLARLERWRSLPDVVQQRKIWSGDAPYEPSAEPARGRLRVGLWCPCLGLGGAEVWQLALARAVDPSRIAWRGAVVIEGRSAIDPRMAAELGALMPLGRGPDAARALASACDVVVSWAVADISEILRGVESPPSIVMACHFPGESAWGSGTEALLSGVDRFVAVSELAVASTPPAIRDRVEVIWNAVEARRLLVRRDRATTRASWGIPPDRPVAGYVGRLAPEKDPDAMLRLARELPEPWHVAIVGEGREHDRLADAIRDRELERTHLVGGDLGVGDVLNAFDALVVPSLFESFGLAMAEGFWAGVPVVATRSGLAKLVPGLVREVEVGASGFDLARAVLDDRANIVGTASRVLQARAFARGRLGADRFGAEWTDLLIRSGSRKKGGPPCSEPIRVA